MTSDIHTDTLRVVTHTLAAYCSLVAKRALKSSVADEVPNRFGLNLEWWGVARWGRRSGLDDEVWVWCRVAVCCVIALLFMTKNRRAVIHDNKYTAPNGGSRPWAAMGAA
uniref:Uncharacterized protein n=1 Tax=Eutreptiella gymnastica TaxID=73025 RepID=A0A7S1JHP1_9EUGL|mmetsp:Transcript_97389/g.167894  ORF Transcript_97389/g.167894 Transcript_97389/m.167894 type:complete len:110 (+) Transcript_97389:82-411(+)